MLGERWGPEAFQSQAWHTDDRTGHAIETAPARPAGGEEPVRILAALVNPDGPAPERETVTLINTSPDPIDLQGWHLADRAKRTLTLPAGPLAAGATLVVPVSEALQLGNNGGAITLLDDAGLKIHGEYLVTESDSTRRSIEKVRGGAPISRTGCRLYSSGGVSCGNTASRSATLPTATCHRGPTQEDTRRCRLTR
ncbi:lamin tail domain-containing protein [Nonomuraea sp. NPDC051941]|uniref:lamin tail domain-containing protein n=1 Tax=Nonomuraea sp. NPDC051941 TaxID=3364373 RepID=UPI0037C55E30